MKNVIVGALLEVEEKKRQKECYCRAKEQSEWRSAIGYKDYSGTKWYKRWLLQFFNYLWVTIKICFIPKRKVKGSRASSGLLKMLLSVVFTLITISLLILALVIPLQYIVTEIHALQITQIIYRVIYGIIAFLFSRLFRMASIEIEKIDDSNYLFGLFASVASIVSIVIAVIALVRGG